MLWAAGDGSWPGETPGQDSRQPRPRLSAGSAPLGSGPLGSGPAGFEHGGPWASAVPCAALAAALEGAAGPDDLCEGANIDALVGIARQWAAVESWAAAGKLAALRAMTREDSDGTPRLRRRPDLPDGWDDSLTYEISGALAMGPVSAGNLASLAWALGTRLARTGRLLADGTLTVPKARLIMQLFQPLDDGEAARAEALILGDLEGKTYLQVERLAWRAALAVAPDVAERRRSAAEKQARVAAFREESGAVGLSGRDLPAAEALAGHANVVARADLYQASGAFTGQSAGSLQVLAYLHLLNGVSAREAITFAASAAPEPPGTSGPDNADGDADGAAPDDGGGCPGPSRGPRPDDGRGLAPDPSGPVDHPAPPGEDHGGHGRLPGAGDGTGSRDREGGQGEPGAGTGERDQGDGNPEDPRTPAPPLAEVMVPLATLQHRADRAGDSRLLGPIDPALARALAAAAARSPASRWEITVVDDHGYATGHGIARPARGARPQAPPHPQPPPTSPAPCALPARVNITITETFLHHLETQAALPRSGAPPPGAWQFTPRQPGTWVLTLPGGRPLTVRLDVVPTHDCDHRYAVSSYLPGDRLRRLVQIRDYECTWPPCSRPARESDFEHAIPYDKGGATDACNAGARSRRCHQVKQMSGWALTQPKPGWHVWTTPTGRTYMQEPWRYTA